LFELGGVCGVCLSMLASTIFAYRYGLSLSLSTLQLLYITMYIIAIAWLYVVFMMAITEQSAVAGIMTFFCYGVFPLTIVLYLMGTPQRKRNRQLQELKKKSTAAPANSDTGMEENDASKHTLRYGNTASAPALDEQMRTQQQQSEEKAAPEN